MSDYESKETTELETINSLREENARLKGILAGDPHLTATKEEREEWRLSAIRYAFKLEAVLEQFINADSQEEIFAARDAAKELMEL